MSDAWESFDRAAFALEEAKSENEQLRDRLERVEQERDRLREAFAETSRLDVSAMEVSAERLKQNETLRARLESAEAALREARAVLERVRFQENAELLRAIASGAMDILDAALALGAAGEKSEG